MSTKKSTVRCSRIGPKRKASKSFWSHKKYKFKKNRQLRTIREYSPLPTRETLTYAEAQKLVDIDVDGKLHRLNICHPLDIIDSGNSDYMDCWEEVVPNRLRVHNKNICQSLVGEPSALFKPAYRVVECADKTSLDVYSRPPAYYRSNDRSADESNLDVEYDMDDQDIAWLGRFNLVRKHRHQVRLSADNFEFLMDRLEKLDDLRRCNSQGSTGSSDDDEDVKRNLCRSVAFPLARSTPVVAQLAKLSRKHKKSPLGSAPITALPGLYSGSSDMSIKRSGPRLQLSVCPDKDGIKRRLPAANGIRTPIAPTKATEALEDLSISRKWLSLLSEAMASFHDSKHVVCLVHRYWLLRRAHSRGRPLIQRLCHDVPSRQTLPLKVMDRYGLSKLKLIRQNMEKVRLLLELVRKRERLKVDWVRCHELTLDVKLDPISRTLGHVLDRLQVVDSNRILSQAPNSPMNFSVMRGKVECHAYSSFEEFEKDFDLLISNCLRSNGPTSSIYRAALTLAKEGPSILTKEQEKSEREGYCFNACHNDSINTQNSIHPFVSKKLQDNATSICRRVPVLHSKQQTVMTSSITDTDTSTRKRSLSLTDVKCNLVDDEVRLSLARSPQVLVTELQSQLGNGCVLRSTVIGRGETRPPVRNNIKKTLMYKSKLGEEAEAIQFFENTHRVADLNGRLHNCDQITKLTNAANGIKSAGLKKGCKEAVLWKKLTLHRGVQQMADYSNISYDSLRVGHKTRSNSIQNVDLTVSALRSGTSFKSSISVSSPGVFLRRLYSSVTGLYNRVSPHFGMRRASRCASASSENESSAESTSSISVASTDSSSQQQMFDVRMY